jgi:hypothetical protein
MKLTTGAEASYVFKYPERRAGDTAEPWSIRQTGVYYKHSGTASSTVFVILHPMYESSAEVRLSGSLGEKGSPQRVSVQPLDQHVLLIRTYFQNWREYMLFYEDKVMEMVSHLTRSDSTH